MSNIVDFFAFTDEVEPVLHPEKKKRKQKKKRLIKEENKAKHEDEKSSSYENTGLLDNVSGPEKEEETDLTKLLGLSESRNVETMSLEDTPPTEPLSTLSSITDREKRYKRRGLKFSQEDEPVIEILDTVTDDTNSHQEKRGGDNRGNVDNGEDDDDDPFLKNLNRFLDSVREDERETVNLLLNQKQEDVKINGQLFEPSTIKFELHVTIQAAGQISGTYELQIKSTTKVGKLISKLLPLFNADAETPFPEEEWPSLVLYIEGLNIILDQSLKCISLLAYKNQLKESLNVVGFEVSVLITTEKHANYLQSTSMQQRMQANIEDEDEMGHTIKLTINDLQNNEKTDLEISLKSLLGDLLSLYKYKKRLPQALKIKLLSDQEVEFDEMKTISGYKFEDRQIINVTYDVWELEELRRQSEFTLGLEMESDEDEAGDDDVGKKHRNIAGGTDPEYFTVYVAGKDKKRYKVDVKPSTKIFEIAKFYIEKAGLDPNTTLSLIFDDEKLENNSKVGDTELEQDFIIDAIIH